MHIAPITADISPDRLEPHAPSRPVQSVPGIVPHHRHQMVFDTESYGRGEYIWYYATSPDGLIILQISGWKYRPEQAHFNWLVEHNFPRCPYLGIHGAQGPWSNDTLDRAILDEVFGAFDFADKREAA